MGKLPLPPGPPGTWIGGNLRDFRRDRLAFLTQCAEEYGDVVLVRFGPRRVYLVHDPELIDSVLVTNAKNFRKHFALRINSAVLGNGLLTSEGDFWLRQRRLSQPAFQKSRIRAYADTMVEETERMLKSWTPGKDCNILLEMMRVTLQIAARTLFGSDVADEATEISDAMRILQANFMRRFNTFLPVPLWVPTASNLRFHRALRRIDEVLYRFIRERRAAADQTKNDLLSLLIQARDENDATGMTDRQLRDEAMTLFLAGHETTALTLSWTWYLLSENPEAQAKLQAELDDVLGGRAPTVEDLPRLKYTEWVIQESMRLYPPAYVIGREALSDGELGGYRLPRGTTVLMSQWVVQRDARHFEKPLEFRPERWDGDLAQRLPKFAYFPFGGGPRMCIGNTFAMMETVLVLAKIGQRWRFTIAPEPPVVAIPTFTLHPQYGIRAILKLR